MSAPAELRITRRAVPTSAAAMRHALRAFLTALEWEQDAILDIVTAVGEALANAIEHAYEDATEDAREVTLYARAAGDGFLSAEVRDCGTFIERARRPGRGFGLRIVRSIASDVSLETKDGTAVRMLFDARKMHKAL